MTPFIYIHDDGDNFVWKSKPYNGLSLYDDAKLLTNLSQ
jgi:hypothetical protein